jgi:NAD(P)-dependent dehydrogenase (short-subunit alcohol dehydrogenase family)
MADAPLAAVTGGARGIGAAYVSALLARGYRVAVLDVSGAAEAAAALAAAQGVPPERAAGFDCDVGDARSFRAAFDAALARFGAAGFAVFVCNAGVVAPLFADAQRQVQVNLVGAILGVEMAVKHATASLTRRAEPPLAIVVTASSNGLVPADSDLAPVCEQHCARAHAQADVVLISSTLPSLLRAHACRNALARLPIPNCRRCHQVCACRPCALAAAARGALRRARQRRRARHG